MHYVDHYTKYSVLKLVPSKSDDDIKEIIPLARTYLGGYAEFLR